MGAKVITKGRITAEWIVKKAKLRKDVNKGTETYIKGLTEGSKIICMFELEHEEKQHKVDVAMNYKNLTLTDEAPKKGDDASGSGGGKKVVGPAQTTLGKAYAFLDAIPTKGKISISENWSVNLCDSDPKFQNLMLQWDIGFMMHQMSKLVPKLTADDLIIINRDNKFEVWTAKAFKAGSLMISPLSSEIKDRFWTQGRASLVDNSAALNRDGQKSFVIDGRLRASPPSADTAVPGRSFSLFWVIERLTDEKECNMTSQVTSANLNFTVTLPQQAVASSIEVAPAEMPQIQIMYNPQDLKKHTRLVALDEKNLKTAYEINSSALAAEKAAAEKAAADLKRKAIDQKVSAAAKEVAKKQKS